MTFGDIIHRLEDIKATIIGCTPETLPREERLTGAFPDGYLAMEATIEWFDKPHFWIWNDHIREAGEIRIPERRLRYGIEETHYTPQIQVLWKETKNSDPPA